MRGAVLYGPRDVRYEERDVPKIIKPTDAAINISAACVCGSDLWPYRGIQPTAQPTPTGHEYCGIASPAVPTRAQRPSTPAINCFCAGQISATIRVCSEHNFPCRET
jgi:hypothetical protein